MGNSNWITRSRWIKKSKYLIKASKEHIEININIERLRKRGLAFLLDQYTKVHIECTNWTAEYPNGTYGGERGKILESSKSMKLSW